MLILSDGYTLPWRWALFVLSIVLSVVMYYVVENPFRNGRFLASAKSVIIVYAIVLLASVALYAGVKASDGWPGRFSDRVVELASKVDDRPPTIDHCEYRQGSAAFAGDYCRVGDLSHEPEWFVYGDSHAWASYSIFDAWLKKNKKSAFFAFRNSCPPITGVYLFKGGDECYQFNQAVTQFVASSKQVNNVFLVSTWIQAKEGLLTPSANQFLGSQGSMQLFNKQFSETLSSYQNGGVNVYVWEPVPGALANVPRAMALQEMGRSNVKLERTLEEYRANYDFFFEALKQNQQRITKQFSPSLVLCEQNNCKVSLDGQPLYIDNNHIANSSAGFWVEALSQQIDIE